MKDYYKILGLDPTISKEEIKKTYRKLSKLYHPDRGGDENKFKEISEAYNTLSDERKRQDYDNRRNNPFGGMEGGNPFTNDDPFDMLNRMFNRGQNRGHKRPQRGEDLSVTIPITVEDIYHGYTKKIKYSRQIICGACDGGGGDWNKCISCGGAGRKRHMTGNGFFQQVVEVSCKACKGQGKTPINLCPPCMGRGRVEKKEIFNFTTPKDARPGQHLTYPGFGNQIKNGVPGNLMVGIEIAAESLFTLEGDDLIYVAEITPLDIILGKKLYIDRFGTELTFELKPLFDTHKRYILRSKGLGGMYNKGNLIVELKVIPPTTLDEKSLKSLQEINDKILDKKTNQ
jgi:molecular chaperone DnaJ